MTEEDRERDYIESWELSDADRGEGVRTYTLDEAAAFPGGLEALTGGAITGPFFEVDNEEDED